MSVHIFYVCALGVLDVCFLLGYLSNKNFTLQLHVGHIQLQKISEVASHHTKVQKVHPDKLLI